MVEKINFPTFLLSETKQLMFLCSLNNYLIVKFVNLYFETTGGKILGDLLILRRSVSHLVGH